MPNPLQTNFYQRPKNPLDQMSLVDRLKLNLPSSPLPINKPQQSSGFSGQDQSEEEINDTTPEEQDYPQSNSGTSQGQQGQQGTDPNHDIVRNIMDSPLSSEIGKRLSESLHNYPSPDQYKPSTKRRVLGTITGGVVGAGYGPERGATVARDTIEAPYKKALEDWKAKNAPIEAEYNLGLQSQKAGFDNLQNYASWVRADAETNLNKVGPLAQAKAAGTSAGELPGKLYLQGRKSADELTQEKFKQGSEDRRTDYTVRASNSRNTQDNQTKVNLQDSQQEWESIEKDLDRKSRERMNERNLEMRKELDKGNKLQRVPVDQQVKAQFQAENEILTGRSGDPKLPKIDNSTMKRIGHEITDSAGNRTGTWMLKPESEVTDPADKKRWNIIKQQANDRSQSLLNSSFSPKFGSTSSDGSPDTPAGDEEWIDTTPGGR